MRYEKPQVVDLAQQARAQGQDRWGHPCISGSKAEAGGCSAGQAAALCQAGAGVAHWLGCEPCTSGAVVG